MKPVKLFSILILFFLFCFIFARASIAVCTLRDWLDDENGQCVGNEIFCEERLDLIAQNFRLCCYTDAECEAYRMPTPNPTTSECPYCYNPSTQICSTPDNLRSCTGSNFCCSMPPENKPEPGTVCENSPGYQCREESYCISNGYPTEPDYICPTRLTCCHVGSEDNNPSLKECISSYGKGRDTSLGCIPTENASAFITWLLSKIIIIASGVAFLLLAIGVFQITTSAGDPKKVQAGSEMITSTLSGLLFIILSLFLLKLIGVDILHLPGLILEK